MAVKKEDADAVRAKAVEPIVTGEAAAQSEAELNHRFNHIAPEGFQKPVFPTPQ